MNYIPYSRTAAAPHTSAPSTQIPGSEKDVPTNLEQYRPTSLRLLRPSGAPRNQGAYVDTSYSSAQTWRVAVLSSSSGGGAWGHWPNRRRVGDT